MVKWHGTLGPDRLHNGAVQSTWHSADGSMEGMDWSLDHPASGRQAPTSRPRVAPPHGAGNRAVTGLILQRVALSTKSGGQVGRDAAAPNGNRAADVLPVIERLRLLWSASGANWLTVRNAAMDPNAQVTDPAAIAALDESLVENERPLLAPGVAKAMLGVDLSDGVGDGAPNHKKDVLKLMDGLHFRAHITNASYDADYRTVNAVQGDTVPTSAMPHTLRAIVQMKRMEAIRDTTPARPAASTPALAELVDRIVQAIGVFETARGKQEPVPVESALSTVPGVKASYRSGWQQITTHVIGVLKAPANHALWNIVDPPITIAELKNAEAVCHAVTTLLGMVKTAASAGTTPDAFILAHPTEISNASLTADDVKKMFQGEALHTTIVNAHNTAQSERPQIEARVRQANPGADQRRITALVNQQMRQRRLDLVPAADRMSMTEGSIDAYTRDPRNWGENAAAWQREAVERMPGSTGWRLRAIAEEKGGRTITQFDFQRQAEGHRSAGLSDKEIILAIARHHNAHPAYPPGVLAEFTRLFGPP